MSQITRIELLSFPGIQADEERCILDFLSRVEVIPISADVETATIALRRKLRLRLGDALILASAVSRGCTLATRDDILLRRAAGVVPCVSP